MPGERWRHLEEQGGDPLLAGQGDVVGVAEEVEARGEGAQVAGELPGEPQHLHPHLVDQ